MTRISRFSALRRVAREFDSAALRRLARAEKMLACAALFLPDYSRHTAAISALLEPCDGPSACATGMQDLRGSGYEALGRSAGGANIEILAREYSRLYGNGPGARTIPLPVVPVCACSYLSGDEGDSLEDVVAWYRAIGFDAKRDPDRCPGHIATELEFQAHCLNLAAAGDEDAVAASRAFVPQPRCRERSIP